MFIGLTNFFDQSGPAAYFSPRNGLKYANVTRSHKMVLKSILVATEILIYSERGENADYYGEKIIVVSVKIKKLWRVKVSGSESSHFEKKLFKVVQHILGIFP